MELAVCSAAISLVFLIACPSAFAGSQHGVSIKVFTSQDDQFWTNSVMIEGVHEVMLVDAQLTKTNADLRSSPESTRSIKRKSINGNSSWAQVQPLTLFLSNHSTATRFHLRAPT